MVAAVLIAPLLYLVSTLSVADTTAAGAAEAPSRDLRNTIKQLTEMLQSGQLPPDKMGQILRKRGSAYSKAGEQDRAINDFNSAIKIKSDDSSAFTGRGKAFQRKREYDKALADFTKAIDLEKAGNPQPDCNKFQDAVNILRCQQYTEAERAHSGSRLSWSYVHRGDAYKEKGEFDLAIADYSEAIRLTPNAYLIYLFRGNAHQLNGNLDLALSDMNEAARLVPEDGATRVFRGDVLFVMGKNNEALASYNEAMRLNAKAVHSRRGVIHYINGDYASAAEDFRTSLDKNPKDSYSALWLFIVRARMGQDGTKDLAAQTQFLNFERWPGKIVMFYLGKASLADSIANVAPASPFVIRAQQCGNRYFIGHYHLIKADKPSALSEFKNVIKECPSTSLVHRLSLLELARQGR